MAEGERNMEVPDSWFDVARKHRVALTVAGLVVMGAAVGVAWWATRDRADDARSASLEGMPQGGSQSGVSTGTGEATGSADATGMASGSVDGTAPAGHATAGWAQPAKPAPRIAYRRDGAVWVAQEDGSGAKAVTGTNAGGYALSLDGRTLAYVDTSGAKPVVAFADVETGAVTKSGTVTGHPSTSIVWLAQDSAVVCVKDDAHLARVPVSGDAEELIPIASERAVFGTSPNGAILAYLGPDVHTLTLRYPDGSSKAIALDDVSDVCCSYDRVFVSYLGSPRVESMLFDGTYRTRLIGAPDTGLGSVWGSLSVSPDGSHVTFSELFNDGYSRMYVATPDGSRMQSLWIRRDTYFLRWESDSSGLVFVEGNAFQGEPTNVMLTNLDGTGRRVLVENAGR